MHDVGMFKIKNLSVKIGKKQILDSIYLDIKPGKVSVLMGPNGSGKTTLAQTLVGKDQLSVISYQLLVNKGKVVFDEKDLLRVSVCERARARLFVSFQNPVEIRGVKVFDFLWEAWLAHGGDPISRLRSPQDDNFVEFRELVVRELKGLGLDEEILDRDLSGFSGGERKRLELLQAILLKPKYVVFDEIDSGMDLDGLKIIERVIKRLQGNKAGILLITHQPEILKLIKPDKIYVLINGKIVKSGNSEILRRLEISGYRSFYCAVCECKEVLCPRHDKNLKTQSSKIKT